MTIVESIVIAAVVGVLGLMVYGAWITTSERFQKNLNAESTCAPYSVLTIYSEQDISYVVCGNQEIRLIKSDEK